MEIINCRVVIADTDTNTNKRNKINCRVVIADTDTNTNKRNNQL